MTIRQLQIAAICMAVGAAGGYAAAWHLGKPKSSPVYYAEAKKIPGGLVLETKPDPKEKPAQAVPRKSKVMAVGKVNLKPKPAPGSTGLCSCDVITISYTETLTDGQPAMQVTTPDAEITGGYHNPIADLKIAPSRPWAVGASIGTDGTWGAAIDRDYGAFRVGIDAFTMDGGIAARAKIQGRF